MAINLEAKLKKALIKDFAELYQPGYTVDYKTKRMLRSLEIGIMRIDNLMKVIGGIKWKKK